MKKWMCLVLSLVMISSLLVNVRAGGKNPDLQDEPQISETIAQNTDLPESDSDATETEVPVVSTTVDEEGTMIKDDSETEEESGNNETFSADMEVSEDLTTEGDLGNNETSQEENREESNNTVPEGTDGAADLTIPENGNTDQEVIPDQDNMNQDALMNEDQHQNQGEASYKLLPFLIIKKKS